MSTPSTTTPPVPAAKPPTSPTRKVVFGVLIAAGVLWLGHFFYDLICFEETDDAFLTGHVHQVSPQIDGTIIEVAMQDNQQVKKGDLLLKLDPLEFEIARDHAQAAIEQAKAQGARAEAGIAEANASLAQAEARQAQAEAQVAQAAAQAKLSRINSNRDKQLFGDGGAVTKSDLDQSESTDAAAQAGEKAARANLKAAFASVESAKANVESARAQAIAAQAALASAQATLKDEERQLADTIIYAPASGRIGNKNAESGNRLRAGQTVAALVESDVWVVANFKETQMSRLKPGMPVEITIDALGGRKLTGKIESIAPASGAEFALLPPDNATGNFTKVVQRVPVRIVLDPESIKGIEDRLTPGLSVDASVRIR